MFRVEREALVASAYVRSGRLFIVRRTAFDDAVKHWPDCGAVIRLEQSMNPRSTAMNAFHWGVGIHLISEHTGMSPLEAHDEMKQLHLPRRFAAVRGIGRIEGPRVFDGSTTNLNNAEEWEFISNYQQWAAEVLDVVIPDPALV